MLFRSALLEALSGMKEGWHNDDYLILFDEAEVATITTDYGIEKHLAGFSVIGLRGWDDFIVANKNGKTFTVPSVPLLEKYMQSFQLPVNVRALEADTRFTGKIKWYVKPVVFGGDPTLGENLTWVNHEQHAQLVRWWNDQYKSASAGASVVALAKGKIDG
jgi:hypothetical protein